MEKLISNDLAKIAIIMLAGVFGLLAVLIKQITRVRGTFKPYQRKTIVYMLLGLLALSAPAIASHRLLIGNVYYSLLFFQFCFLVLGITHLYLMRAHLRWAGEEKAFVPEMIFTIMMMVLGSIGFAFAYSYFSSNESLKYVMAGSSILFVVPFFFMHTFRRATAIPPRIVKEWYYPVKEEPDDPDETKLRNLLVISFEFQKRLQENALTNFRAKAPSDMEFGQLFYYFINDYNERHPDSKVEFANGSGKPHGWIFYKKPHWYTIATQYIDVDKTIFNNNIKENDVIVCTRSLS